MTTLSFGQAKKISEIKELYWGANDRYNKSMDIPAKWQGESGVVIYQEFNYIYEGSSRSVDYIESIRRRIKLLDKSAVEEYSEFSFAEKFKVSRGFSKKGGRVFAGFKVIKPNGTENEIDLDDAVEIQSESNENLKKIAIPDLGIGDIIDYYYYIYEPFITSQEYIFSPVLTTLNGSYPIMNQKISFEVEKNFFVNFSSYNGAPELKEIPSDDKKKTIYVLEDQNREKDKDLRWFYPDRVFPLVKFQVIYARKGRMEESADAFMGEKGEVLSNVTMDDIEAYFHRRFNFEYKSKINDVNEHNYDKDINSDDTEKMVKEAYLFYRHKYLMGKIEPVIFYEEGYISTLPYDFGGFLNEIGFIRVMAGYLRQKKIDFHVLVGVSRRLGNIDDVLLKAETDLLIRVNTENPIFLSPFALYSDPGRIPYYLEGTDAYQMETYSKGLRNIEKTSIPVSSPDDNKSKQQIKMKIGEDMETISVLRKSQHYGHNKDGNQSDLGIIQDYLDDDYAYFDKEEYIEKAPIKKKNKAKVIEQLNEQKAKQLKRQKESFENELEQEMESELKSYDSYKITNSGRWANNEDRSFSYEENFSIEGMIKKAGKNYIVNIGRFIGSQVALKEDEMERDQDVYMIYPRSFENEIVLEIPEGFTVEGLDKLQKSVVNSTGKFISTAKIEGNELIITTNKVYNHNFEKKENWQGMVDFLEAGFQFTQEKILLRQ